jgi:DNA-binding transcriptional LysR family regulator
MKLTVNDIAPADMLLFADVVQQSSFTAAAQLNGISKQAVSDRIGKLEAALGVRLLQRTTRSLRLTDAGTRYHQDCAEIAQRIAKANVDMQAERAEPVGTLTVSAPILFGRGCLLSVLKTWLFA